VLAVKVKDGKIAFFYPEDGKILPIKRKKGKAPALVE